MARTPSDPAKQVKSEKQSTLVGFFGRPKPGPAPCRPSSASSQAIATTLPSVPPTSSPTSATLRTPSSVVGSSPHVVVPSSATLDRGSSSPCKANGPASPLKQSMTPRAASVDMDDSPVVMSRRAKRKVVYAESESDASGPEAVGPSVPTAKKDPSRKPRKSLKACSDSSEYEFDEQDDIAMVAAMDGSEGSAVSPTPSIAADSPPAKAKSRSKPPPKSTTARPGPRPLLTTYSRDDDSRPNSSRGGGPDSVLMTAAERRKLDERTAKREAEQCYDFLKEENIRDKERRRPDHPDFDKRTVHVPDGLKMTPFEKQFWDIKQDHFDTVLFFQKGKFYELYENDAQIGHQEFDLKLTDRVKMKMVGVPEQSFDMWAQRFLAAGYKVGKVEQAETAIGHQMRNKGATKAEDKIVRRELHQVFTNGTIVDGTYLTSDEANHCVSIKEHVDESTGRSSFGVCTMDASTGEFNLSAFSDDVVYTRLETFFRQIRPKELLHPKGNLSVSTDRLLRNILPSNVLRQSFQDGKEFFNVKDTLKRLGQLFATEEDDPSTTGKALLPPAIESMLDTPLALEALGGMLFYLESLNLDKDLVSQKNFNIYDPIKEGKNLVLDGVTLGHMEVLVNNEGGTEGTLLELLQRCQTPFGKRLFRIWLMSPLRDVDAINQRLDAVDDLMNHPTFTATFKKFVKKMPDLERLISRIHARSSKESEFKNVVDSYIEAQQMIDELRDLAEGFNSQTVAGLLRSAPDLTQLINNIRAKYHIDHSEDKKTLKLLPQPGANEDCDNASEEVSRIDTELQDLLLRYSKQLGCKEITYWHSGQGGKEIYQIQVPAKTKVPETWSKQGGSKNLWRYYNRDVLKLVREIQEAREVQAEAKRNFFRWLLGEFDRDRSEWLGMIRVVAELDCLVSLALASFNLDEPKCRPTFVNAPQAFIDFQDLRHPSMCLRSEFIANDVNLGGSTEPSASTSTSASAQSKPNPRTILLTGPNMAGKSTLLRMTAAGIIMAQMGCYVPAQQATLSPVDKIQTRMGAYDNMFASASTFKVELDECSKILREAGPRSFVILDELGRGTSTFDGMAIASAVLHHLATHTLPLAFFATHYGSLTDDFTYHPNIRKMHMQTHVDDDQRRVVFLYKFIPGVAESSHGTHVATMAGVPQDVVDRADEISAQFQQGFKLRLNKRRESDLPVEALADIAWLIKLALKGQVGHGEASVHHVEGDVDMDESGMDDVGMVEMVGGGEKATVGQQLDIIQRARYDLV